MIDAGDLRTVVELFEGTVLLLVIKIERRQERLHAALNRMAEPDRPDGSAAEHRAGQHRHRIGIVEEPGVRADFLHVTGKIHHHRNGAESAENAADAERVRNRLTQPVFFRNFKVDHGGGLITADLNGIHHEISPLESFLPIGDTEMRRDLRTPSVDIPVERREHLFRFDKPLPADVVKRDVGIFQSLSAHAVAKHVFCKYRAARSHEGDFCHSVFLLIWLTSEIIRFPMEKYKVEKMK